jgi:hypothetical protein
MARKKRSVLVVLRQGLLFYLLLMVALGAYLTRARSTDWNEPLTVAVYPVNGDGSDAATRYIDQLDADSFSPIVTFFARETSRYGVPIEVPVRFALGNVQAVAPPSPPASGHALGVIAWSLKLRLHTWRVARRGGVAHPDIRLFVLYHDPATNPVLNHSLGLQKGLIGVVNAYASRHERARNAVVITHEILHTLGASDKYDPATNQPLHPDGFAEPQRRPLYPQVRTEIMAGRFATSATEAQMPQSLRSVVVGALTATEIRWTGKP